MRVRRRPPRSPRPLAAAAGLACGLVCVLALTGCTGSSSAAPAVGSGGAGFVAGDGTLTIIEPGRRGAPIDLSGRTLEGQPIDLATYRGTPVVLNVWASWCAPCRKEAPDLLAAYRQLNGPSSGPSPTGTATPAADRVAFLGINTREEDRAQALAFQRRFGITYRSLDDARGTALLALRGAVAPNAIPTTLVLDAQGRVAARITGATTTATLVGVVRSAQAP